MSHIASFPLASSERRSSRGGFVRSRRQAGVALFVVLVFVMLSMLLALWASRTSLFNELVVGNDADYQRAFEAAQALIQDAELDIRGEKADGTPCVGAGDICRTTTVDKMPQEAQHVGPMLAELVTQSSHCRNGLCIKRIGRQDFWNYPTSSTTVNPAANAALGEVPLDTLAASGVGARYGQYTGAQTGGSTSPANPLLQWDASTPANQGGWYWTEVLPYDESSQLSGVVVKPAGSGTSLLPLNLQPAVVYRITALAYGRKPSTMVVLQETYARSKRKD